MSEQPVREAVVDEIMRAVAADDQDAMADVWQVATAQEKQAAASRHGALASLLQDRAAMLRLVALKQAVDLLAPHWQSRPEARDGRIAYCPQTLGAVLKTCPPHVAREVLRYLRDFGWLSNDDI